MTASTTVAPALDATQAVQDVLQQAERPLTLTEIQRRVTTIRISKDHLPDLVRELIRQGKAFLCSPAGPNDRYWGHEEFVRFRAKAEELLAVNRLTEADLVKALGQALPKAAPAAKVKELVQRMRSEGRLFEHPVKGKSTRQLGLQPYIPAIVLNKGTVDNLRKALALLQSHGSGIDRLLELIRRELDESPAPETRQDRPAGATTGAVSELEELILKGMRDLQPGASQGMPVPLRELRRNMPVEYRGRDSFDRAVLRLAEQGRLVIHRHDRPTEVAEEERAELVRDDGGTFYTLAAYPV